LDLVEFLPIMHIYWVKQNHPLTLDTSTF